MTVFSPVAGLAGGILIGLSALLLMAFHGRIAGLSGIFGGLLTTSPGAEFSWRLLFIIGLLAGAALTALAGLFDASAIAFAGTPVTTVIGGLLVGAGTALGSGCTSGHGICGMARLSQRSLAATSVFMGAAIATVFIVRHLVGA